MTTIKKYFDTDFKSDLMVHKDYNISQGDKHCQVIVRLHLDYIKNAAYISYFIPICDMDEKTLCDFMLDSQYALQLKEGIRVKMGLFFEEPMVSDTMCFTNLIYVYSEKDFSSSVLEYLKFKGKEKNLIIKVRGNRYVKERVQLDLPRAFISYDHRDRSDIARPLAEHLSSRMCTVWYDEYSLRIGDDLRESIEKGIKECKKCILVISPNFLSNRGWTKKEFNSIFQRELMSGEKLILPIWHNVAKQDVYDYCPSLVDVVAISSLEGLTTIENKIYDVLMN